NRKTLDPIPASRLIEEARKLVGIPYHHQGRNKFGVDCIGLFVLAFEEAGSDLVRLLGVRDTRDYGRHRPNPKTLELLEHNLAARLDAPVPGCLIAFRFVPEVVPRHYGLFTERGTFVHADGMRKLVCETRYADPWLRRVHSLWRLPGVTYGA
ncbi:MAG TPA: NlpC/P60 family protein, partial [Burkholderiales bacterium]